MEVCQYTEQDEKVWDDFVLEKSENGVFLQSRKFLNYHPKDRFEDYSLLLKEGNKLLGVCPAAVQFSEGKKVFFSHPGSTYGGIILDKKQLSIQKEEKIIEKIIAHLKKQGFKKVVMKQTSPFLCRHSCEGIEYAFWRAGFLEFKEVNFIVDLDNCKMPIVSNFSQGKRTNINHCLEKKLYMKVLTSKELVFEFYRLLCKTLEKYDKKPIHTYRELIKIQEEFREAVLFTGIFMGSKMLAGAMLFLFLDRKRQSIHTQYLASDPDYNKLSPMSFLQYSIIEYALKEKMRYVSWGIATENRGTYLNLGLSNSKEAFGSEHSLNKIFVKEL